MGRSLLETKILINQILLVIVGVFLAGAFTVGAFGTGQWAWLVAVPMNLAGIALVVLGGRRRRRTQGSRGMGISVVGALFIVGSIWAALMLGNAFST